MGWREVLLERLGPGLLGGVTLGQWLRLVASHGAAMSPALLPRAASITFNSVSNSVAAAVEGAIYGRRIAATEIPPPLFIVGHWRHGTTHLHNLLAVDDRFAWPTTYEACFPSAFLVTERLHAPLVDFFLPRTRPMDNIAWSMASPQEDEFALVNLGLPSPYSRIAFPNGQDPDAAGLDLDELPSEEQQRWETTLLDFYHRLLLARSGRLVLKSPPHTCRVPTLRRLFPDACYFYLVRNPRQVIPSTVRLWSTLCATYAYQRPDTTRLVDQVLETFAHFHARFEATRRQIPYERLHVLRYEEFVAAPESSLREIYEKLDLGPFNPITDAVRKLIADRAAYRANQHEPDPALGETIERATADYAKQYGY